jgi:UTP--glucose-1-phosphate uridylyltransferase
MCIKQYFDIIQKPIKISYVFQEEQKGLGHAIVCAKEYIGKEPFAIILGDDLIKSEMPAIKQLIDLHKKTNSSVLGVKTVEIKDIQKYGIVVADSNGLVKSIIEKPSNISEAKNSTLAVTGRYILTPEIFELIEKYNPPLGKEIGITEPIISLLNIENIFALQYEGKYYDLGSVSGFVKANNDF